jgi:hypothetical protein
LDYILYRGPQWRLGKSYVTLKAMHDNPQQLLSDHYGLASEFELAQHGVAEPHAAGTVRAAAKLREQCVKQLLHSKKHIEQRLMHHRLRLSLIALFSVIEWKFVGVLGWPALLALFALSLIALCAQAAYALYWKPNELEAICHAIRIQTSEDT